MDFYQEPSRKLPIRDNVEVLVVGGGPAGFSAAVNAARNGVKTMLIEQSGDVGGVATTGLMSHWTGNTIGGFYDEILNRSSDYNDKERRHIINPEKLKLTMLQMLEEAGAKLRLYTFASHVIVEDNCIKGIIVESKTGREVILSKIIIDATGDGDIAAKSGVPYFKGRESDGKMQPMTLMFKVGGVDYDRAVFPGAFEETFEIPAGDLQSLGKEHLPYPAGHVLLYRSSLPGVVTCNMTNCIDVDGTNAEDLTHATIVCRKQMDAIVSFLKEFVPGFAACYALSSASIIGVRETRHFQGEYTLTEEDILNARAFDDWIVTKAHFNFDVHNITGSGLDSTGVQKNFKQNRGYTIPYGCFVPVKIDNLYLTGRNISGTHMAHSNFRIMPICANMGQGVGIAASLCVKENTSPRKLQVEHVQSILRSQGVEL